MLSSSLFCVWFILFASNMYRSVVLTFLDGCFCCDWAFNLPGMLKFEMLAPPPPYRRESTPVSMSTDVLLSLLMLSIKPSDGLRAGFVDVSHSCRICWCVGLRAGNMVVGLRADVFLAGFGNVPVQGRCCRNFQLFFKLLTFLSCHSRAISSFLCSGHRGRRRTRSEGRRHRKSGHPHPDRRRDRTLGRSRREPLAE